MIYLGWRIYKISKFICVGVGDESPVGGLYRICHSLGVKLLSQSLRKTLDLFNQVLVMPDDRELFIDLAIVVAFGPQRNRCLNVLLPYQKLSVPLLDLFVALALHLPLGRQF